jgi:hypothetical protein
MLFEVEIKFQSTIIDSLKEQATQVTFLEVYLRRDSIITGVLTYASVFSCPHQQDLSEVAHAVGGRL